MRIVGWFFSLLFVFIASGALGQAIIKSRHETDAQKSVDIEFNTAPVTAPTIASFTVSANGLPMAIVAVTSVSSSKYRITFSAALPVDPDPVLVTYLPNGSNVISENNRILKCSDFEWETNTRPTPSCAPVDPINKMIFSVKPGARNSSNFGLSKIESRISWNDPQNTISSIAPYESDESGSKIAVSNYITFDADLDDFLYPGDENDCFYTSEWKVFINGVGSCSSTDPNQFITYTSHNVDDKGNGELIINPSVSYADQVCLNDEVNVQFIDGSSLNCTDGVEPLNSEGRWVRIIYGDPSRTAGERIPNIHINGIPVTDERGKLIDPLGAGNLRLTSEGIIYTGDGADIFGVRFFPSPVDGAVGDFLPITTQSSANGLANRDPGDQFTVRMQYWNICNPYDNIGNISHNEVSRARDITIIDIPNPPVADPKEICTDAAVGTFSVIDTVNSTEIRWYDADPDNGGNLLVNPLGTNSIELPANGIVDNTTPGVYSVWATAITGANSCESDAVETFITVREALAKPGEITGSGIICNGSSNIIFELPDAEGATNYGGDWEYFWSHSDGNGITFDNNTGQSVSVDFNISSITGDFTTRTIKVVKQYKDASPGCTSEVSTFQVRIYGPSEGGAVASDNTICAGENTRNLILSGYRGTVLKWQRQDNGGSYIDLPETAGMDTLSEILTHAGEYNYRAVVVNGACNEAYSSPATITVNPVPQKPVITEANGNSFTTCAGGGEIRLKSSNVGELGNIFTWYKTSDLINPVQSGASDELVLNDVTQSGSYVVKLSGASPTNCESELSDSVTVTINPLPSAIASGGGSVCSGNPAPDIVWELTGKAPFNFTISVTGQPDIVESSYNSYTYTITAPQPEVTTEYEMISLSDASNCVSGSLGGIVSVTIGGTAPVFENGTPKVGPSVCDNGSTTEVPSLTLDLDLQGTYKLIYNVNDEANQSIIFTTDPDGVFVLQPDYNSGPFNSTPGTYEYNLISISNTNTGCLTPVNQSYDLIINPRPHEPSGQPDIVICADSETGGVLAVDDPGTGYSVRWFSSYSSPSLNTPVGEEDGMVSGTNNRFFTSASSETATFYAALQDSNTGCLSSAAVAVKQTKDIAPVANADIDGDNINNITCSSEFVLQANPLTDGATGIWTGPAGITFSNVNDPSATVSNLPVGRSTLRWTVNSAYEVCSTVFDEIIVERFDLPTAIDPSPELCTDSDSGTELEVKGIDLAAEYKDLVTGVSGSADLEVMWFSDQDRTIEIADPANYTANNTTGKKVYTRVINTTTNCSNDGELTFTVHALPMALDHSATMCEDELNGNEVANIDLTTYNNDIIGPASVSDREVEWFSDNMYSIEVPDPSNVSVSNNEVFYARVTDTTNPSLCTNDAKLTFTVNPLPEENPITGPTMQCAGSNIQLYQIEPSLGSTYNWNVPPAFTVFGGGGREDFFILLNFPDTATADLQVTEISADGCVGNVQKLTIQVVGSPPPLSISPANAEICENEAGVVFNVDNLPNTTYAWTVPSGATIIKGQGTNQVTVNFGQFGGNVSVVPTSTTGNCAGTSAKTSVTINQRPQLENDLSNTVCSGEISGITLTYLSSGTPATGYDIIDIAVDPGLISDNSNAATGTGQPTDAIYNDIYINQKAEQLSVRYTIQPRSSKGCLGTASVIILDINPEPRLNTSLNKEKCSGEASGILLSVANGSFPADSYNVLSVNDGELSPDTLNNTYSGAFPYNNVAANFLQNEKYRNYASNPVDIIYKVVPVSSGCAGRPSFVTLTVNPEPVGSDVIADAKCSGETFNLVLQEIIDLNNEIESNFKWTANYGPDITGGISAGSGDIRETLFNTGSSQETVIYTVTPSSLNTNCNGPIFTITLPVNPQIESHDQNISVCSNETIIDLTALDSAVTAGIDNPVSWFSDASTTVEISSPESYDTKDLNSVYAVVTEGICSKVAKVSFSLTEITVSAIGVTSDYNGYNVSCIGASDATIKFEATGGVEPYYFVLNEDTLNTTGTSTGEFSGLSAGSYSVTVTDATGCSSGISDAITVNDPLPLNAGTIFGTSNICQGSLPSAFIQVNGPSGGTGSYIFQWQVSADSISFRNTNGPTSKAAEYEAVSEDFSNGEGTYYFRRLVSSGTSVECMNVSSNVIKINVNVLPTGDFTFKDTNGNPITEICSGEPFLIEFKFTNSASQYTFDYHDDKGKIYSNNIGTSTTTVLVNFDEVTRTTTFTLDSVRDMYGCKIDTALNISHTIDVINTDAEFTVIGSRETCSPATIDFKYNQIRGVTYTWKWFDGTPDSAYTATTTEAEKTITHTFRNGSPTTTINYEVALFAVDTSAAGTVCESYSHEKVTVYPKVQANVFAQNPVACSGDEIKFINLSLGASAHRWLYRELGNEGQEEQVQITQNASFKIVNRGAENPQVYEVVYTGLAEQDGENTCTDTQVVLVEVYKEVTPDFTFTPDPPLYENGASQVTFTNMSIPNNDTVNFSYNWDFDDDLKLENTADPGIITYSRPGQKTVVLTVVNKAFPGLCDVSVSKTINIQNLKIRADFSVSNENLCRNSDVVITNKSTGEANEFIWEIFDENGVLVHKQIDMLSPEEAKLNPSFTYTGGRAGVYDVHLTARNAYSNDTQKVVKNGAFEVYELPVVNFDTRPDVVFIPDQPLITYNLSNGADSFSWNFGDGSPLSSEFEPEHYYTQEGSFNVTLIASAIYPGITCSDSLTRIVVAKSGGDVELPNAFTPSPYGPSGDGRIRNEEANDIFLPITKGVVDFHMVIFNRWGDMIFQSTDSTVGWDGYDRDGRLMPAGVYIYQLTLELSNGQRKQISGDVMLIK
ncbi:MAG: PKD-like domain-containing protein [Candidatus Cyclobacteriaceae bacterium M2_1C_046]